MSDHENLLFDFCSVTEASPEQAREYLDACHGNLDLAVTAFFSDADVPSSNGDATEPDFTGPRTLDGRPAPEDASWSTARKAPKRQGLATLGSLRQSHGDDESNDQDDEHEHDRRGLHDFFAGGVQSGLAVQDPAQRSGDKKKLVDAIVNKLKENARHGGPSASPPPRTSAFRGAGQTLGGEGFESRVIPNPRGSAIATPSSDACLERTLHFWQDGFSIDDGPLFRFDGPSNRGALAQIRQGQTPIQLMNILPGQEVDVRIQTHEENWHQLPRIYRPFGGEGRRLGSPVPGGGSASATFVMTSAPGAPGPATAGTDEGQPTLALRIQLPDGSRLPARFKPTQTIGDVYDFVTRASASVGCSSRSWVIATTFPNKDHTDKSLALNETAEFKKGGIAVVKWVDQ